MANHYHQLSLKDTFSDCKDMFMDDVPSFFQLLDLHFDISLFIPQTFYNAFYQHLGRKRDYHLTGFLSGFKYGPRRFYRSFPPPSPGGAAAGGRPWQCVRFYSSRLRMGLQLTGCIVFYIYFTKEAHLFVSNRRASDQEIWVHHTTVRK